MPNDPVPLDPDGAPVPLGSMTSYVSNDPTRVTMVFDPAVVPTRNREFDKSQK